MRTAVRARGVTLIELMISVALIGLAGTLGFDAALILRRQANDIAQRERALQVLEFEAAALSSGAAGDPAVRARLLGELPEPMVDTRRKDQVTIVTVSWQRSGTSRESRSLAVFARRGR